MIEGKLHDVVTVMEARRRAFRSGDQPPRYFDSGWLRLPGYQPHEIARMAGKIRRRIKAWRGKRP